MGMVFFWFFLFFRIRALNSLHGLMWKTQTHESKQLSATTSHFQFSNILLQTQLPIMNPIIQLLASGKILPCFLAFSRKITTHDHIYQYSCPLFSMLPFIPLEKMYKYTTRVFLMFCMQGQMNKVGQKSEKKD